MTTIRTIALLREYIHSGHSVAERLSVSLDRITPLIPLRGPSIRDLTTDEEERLDAFLFRFASLAAIVQDHVSRAVLMAEEEYVPTASRKE